MRVGAERSSNRSVPLSPATPRLHTCSPARSAGPEDDRTRAERAPGLHAAQGVSEALPRTGSMSYDDTRLQLGARQAGQRERHDQLQDETMSAQRRVLVVEDDQDICEAVSESLEDAGYGVSLASNGAVA